MIRRFRLEQKSYFEKLVIAQRLSDMLDRFLGGRIAPLKIGAEMGGIEEWDDVVILHSPDSLEHLQIKRNTTDFCTKNPDKNAVQAKGKKGNSPKAEPANSVIDSAFASLARHVDLGTFNSTPNRQFQLTLLGAHLKIKDDLTVNHLDELCKIFRRDGFNLDQLENRQDGPTNRAYLWLTTWCGFRNWAHIRDALHRVKIACVGDETTLEQRSIDSLSRHFSDPNRTLQRLITYITTETSDVSALDCHAVVRELRAELRPDVETWAQYCLGDANLAGGKSWFFAGTHDLGETAPGLAQGVVGHMWSSEAGNRRLRIHALYTPALGENLTLPSAILRMALHLSNGSQSLMLNEPMWRGSVGHEVGHTLGCTESDLNHLPWLENPERLACALDHEFKTQGETRAEAEALASAMDDLVWQRLTHGVSEKLAAISDSVLADAMEKVWLVWLDGFNKHPDNRREFLKQLLYPKTEGKNAKHALRLGPRTLDLLVTAVETLLLVAVGIEGSGNDWTSFPDCGQVQSIALKYWSGPAGCVPEVRELSDDPLMTVIGPSPAPVVILSGLSNSPSDLLNFGMADDAEATTSMAAERQPHLLVTRSGMFKHLRSGSLASVRQHFTKQWHDRLRARESAIAQNAQGL